MKFQLVLILQIWISEDALSLSLHTLYLPFIFGTVFVQEGAFAVLLIEPLPFELDNDEI